MSTDEVVFKANGEWSFGQPISEMDVKAERSAGAPANSPAPGTTPTPAGEGTPAKKTRKKLDMNKLKKSAGKAAKPVDPKEVASAEEKPAPKKTKKETKPVPASEPEPVPAPEPIPEPEPAPVPVPEPESIPEPEPEPAPSAPVEEPKKAQEFKLKQMGLSDRPESSEDMKPAQEPVIASEPPKHTPAPEPTKSAPAPAPAPKPTPEPVKDNGPDPDFIFHNLEEFCEVSGATIGVLSKFARAVVRAAASKTAIWESKDMSPLRVYSCTPVSGRGVPAGVRCLLAVGYDIHMTCCYVSDSFAVTDGSSNLKCVGTCAYVRDTPVALSMERKREAVTV